MLLDEFIVLFRRWDNVNSCFHLRSTDTYLGGCNYSPGSLEVQPLNIKTLDIAYLMDTYGEACNNLILSFRPQYCHSSSFYHFNLRTWDQCLTHSGIGHLWGSLQQTLSIIPTSFLAPLKGVGSLQPDLAHIYV